jgi:hypothetical protein
MKAQYPDAIDDFHLPLSREEYNAGVTDERPLSPLRFAYILQEVERHLFELDAEQGTQDETLQALDKEQDSLASLIGELQTKMKTVETELDAITEVISIAAAAPPGALAIDEQGRLGVGTTTPTEKLHVLGKTRSTDTMLAENGHGQFTDFPSVSCGYQNLRNGVLRLYCIDTVNYIEVESPDDISQNRKQYLQNKTGKVVIEESDDGRIDVTSGYEVGGTQVVGPRIQGWATPTGTSDRTARWDADNPDLNQIAIWLKALYEDLVTHGLLGE